MNKTILRGSIATLIGSALVLGTAVSAQAAETEFQIAWTEIGIYPRTAPSMDPSTRAGDAVPDGTWIDVVCETYGETVTSAVTTSDIWERTADGTYYPNAFVSTGVNGRTPGIPDCGSLDMPETPQIAQRSVHDSDASREDAVQWARDHYDESQLRFMSECTIFVSRALWAGGFLQTDKWTNETTDSDEQGGYSTWNQLTGTAFPSKAATVAHIFVDYAVSSGLASKDSIDWNDNTAGGAQLGDVIAYDWEGDDHIDHLAFVTAINDEGYPFVTQRTSALLDRYWSWSESADNWIGEAMPGSQAYVLHVNY